MWATFNIEGFTVIEGDHIIVPIAVLLLQFLYLLLSTKGCRYQLPYSSPDLPFSSLFLPMDT